MKANPPAHARPLWDSSSDYIQVSLHDVEVEAHVGLHPWEQHPERPSRLLVTVEMFAHLARGRAVGSARPLIDYDRVRNGLRGWSSRPHTLLLETLAEEVVALCLGDPAVEACRAAIARDLAASGWRVVVHYNRSEAEAQALAEEIARAGGAVELVQADLASRAEVEAVFPRALEKVGRIDCLINNAANFQYDAIE